MKATNLKALSCATALLTASSISMAYAQTGVTPAEARVIAKEAYVYGYPMVDAYPSMWSEQGSQMAVN